jgi:hypothetical protein
MGAVSTILNSGGGAINLVQKGGSVASLALATKALVRPQNQVEGINGLVFDIPESEELNLSASITDHVVEDNTTLNDHIAIAPVKINLTGKVSELVLKKSTLQKYAETVLNVLGSVGALSPAMSQSAMEALSLAIRAQQAVEQSLKKLASFAELFGGDAAKTAQQRYYETISQYLYSKGLFTVQTPWKTFENMAIESVSFSQDESTTQWSTINVSLKQITLAKTKQLDTEIKGRVKLQKAPVENKGTAKGKDTSMLKQGLNWATGKG